MPSFVPITIHETQWPHTLAAQLRECLRSGRINHKFHYHSHRQVRQWLRLHEAWSPSRAEATFRQAYWPAFDAALERWDAREIHLIGLGCGGGQKEAALLERLQFGGRSVAFTATDVSCGMVITTLRAAWAHLDSHHCSGLVCDLAEAQDLQEFFESQAPPQARRLVTLFGMIPNFEPEMLQALLKRVVRPGDVLLFSANLASGPDYRRGVEQVLAQYDNQLTREWLWLLLADLGVAPSTGRIWFGIEEWPAGTGWLRIVATFSFQRSATLTFEGESLRFDAGRDLRLLFSYRHTTDTLNDLVASAGLDVLGSWMTDSGEEGVFLAEACGAVTR